MVETNGAKLPQFTRRRWWLYDVWIIVWLLPVKQWTLFLQCEKCMETSDALMQMPVIYFWVLSTFIFLPLEIPGFYSDEGVCLSDKPFQMCSLKRQAKQAQLKSYTCSCKTSKYEHRYMTTLAMVTYRT